MTYSAEDKITLFTTVCTRMCEGESIRSICADLNLAKGTFFKWVNESKENSDQYARATKIRADVLFEEIFEIADDISRDNTENSKGETIENKEWVNRSRLRIDSRKWALSKMLPKKYGDKLDLTSDGEALKSAVNVIVQDSKTAAEVDKLMNNDND